MYLANFFTEKAKYTWLRDLNLICKKKNIYKTVQSRRNIITIFGDEIDKASYVTTFVHS